jgi:hypothetical protein
LITNGFNVGIVQLVGQAISKVKMTETKKHVTAIGICKWGSIKDVEILTNSPLDEVEFIFIKYHLNIK